MNSEFFAALAGALVAGAISGFLQWQSFKIQRTLRLADQKREARKAEEDERERESVLAFSIGVKLVKTLSSLQQIKEHLDTALIEMIRTKMDLGSALRPFSSDFERISFSIEELSFAKSLRKDTLINNMIDLPGIMDLYIDNLALFRQIKSAMMELAESISLNPQGVASTVFRDRNGHLVKLKMAEANVLMCHLLGRAIVDYPLAHRLLRDFQVAALNRLGRERLGFVWELTDEPIFRRPRSNSSVSSVG